MQTNQERLPLFFSVDDHYVPFLLVALKSMMANAKLAYKYQIIILHEGIKEENQKQISELANDQFDIKFVSMKGQLNKVMKGKEAKLRGDYFTFTIFFRLFIADMFAEYDKAVYLDADIIVPGDIGELYQTDIGDNLVGATSDFFIGGNPFLAEYSENSIGVPAADYINSGVLVMNLKQFRSQEFSNEFLYLYNKYHFETVAPDQDYLNAIGQGRIYHLGDEWNAQAGYPQRVVDQPKLVHYNLFNKPWSYAKVAYGDYFWKYAKQIPGSYEAAKAMQAAYSPEQIQADKDNYKGLVKNTQSIIKSGETFKVFYKQNHKPNHGVNYANN
ncbi:glycosyl transferase [Pediococcus damnosus LMG 28219]|uniref:glycosyltransferase family 8 protein n=1 Tax=Pediococcus damnosus TaxID=51663 RepID=UPI00061DF427|nr:glycosyltransferase family 8 protein [Pediococcus damnosus]KJU74730.1 glycosyl transferase [Pediococcus damnosus LMG 28219]